ncbi:MAG: YCF48-related protein [Candidatus Moraniibacteriota bacterium]
MENKKSFLLLPVILALPLAGPSCNLPQNDGGVYKTTDGGENWKQIVTIEDSKNTLIKTDTEQLLLDPSNPNVVFLATVSQGLYVSNQFGESWKRLVPEVSTVYAIEPDTVRKGTYFASVLLNDRGKIIKTENAGNDWKEVYTETGKDTYVTHLKADPFFPDSLVAANTEGLLMRSSDGGVTWQATFPFQDSLISLDFDPVVENNLWALTQRGVWISRDGGVTFDLLTLDPSGEMGNQFYLLQAEQEGLFLATDRGFFKSLDGGSVWEKIITLNNPANYPVRTLVMFPGDNGKKWVVGAGMALYITEDGGENWKPIQFEISRMVNAVLIKPDETNQMLVGVANAKTLGGFGY